MDKISSGDTSWLLMATALVMLMTPGLAFFYAGMVRTKNVVSTLYQNMMALGVVGLVWAICGYSLSFSGNSGGLIGDLNFAFLKGVGAEPSADFAATIPHSLFMLFQCMFAIITPALISGAIAERIQIKAWLVFIALWSLFIYSPVAHWVWGTEGWIRNLGVLDFAGGAVVHITAGYSAVVAALVLGKRKHVNEHKPYDVGMVLLGTTLLWFGWFGFNGGSALAANGLAVHAFGTTFLSSISALVAWTFVDIFTKGKPNTVGACCAVVVGLVTITPAAGFVTFSSAILMGLLSGAICNFAIGFIKKKFASYDDTLDVFGCHGVGGTLGMLFTGIFASKAVNPAGADGLLYGNPGLLVSHIIGTLGVIAASAVGTFLILKVVDLITPIRVSETEEYQGLDVACHGESINSNFEPAYHKDNHQEEKSKNISDEKIRKFA